MLKWSLGSWCRSSGLKSDWISFNTNSSCVALIDTNLRQSQLDGCFPIWLLIIWPIGGQCWVASQITNQRGKLSLLTCLEDTGNTWTLWLPRPRLEGCWVSSCVEHWVAGLTTELTGLPHQILLLFWSQDNQKNVQIGWEHHHWDYNFA